MAAYRTHLGVRIEKVEELWPNLKELRDGRIVELSKPIVMNTSYKYAEGYPYNTLAECKDAIDRVLKRCKEVGAESRPKEFAAIMNGE